MLQTLRTHASLPLLARIPAGFYVKSCRCVIVTTSAQLHGDAHPAILCRQLRAGGTFVLKRILPMQMDAAWHVALHVSGSLRKRIGMKQMRQTLWQYSRAASTVRHTPERGLAVLGAALRAPMSRFLVCLDHQRKHRAYSGKGCSRLPPGRP